MYIVDNRVHYLKSGSTTWCCLAGKFWRVTLRVNLKPIIWCKYYETIIQTDLSLHGSLTRFILVLSFLHLVLNHSSAHTVFCLHGCFSKVSKNFVSRVLDWPKYYDLMILKVTTGRKSNFLAHIEVLCLHRANLRTARSGLSKTCRKLLETCRKPP